MARSYPGSTTPTINDLMNPVLHSLRELGGSATNAELLQAVTERLRLAPEVADFPHLNGSRSELDYRIAWAKTNLKGVGLVDNSQRGVWSLTQQGRNTNQIDLHTFSKSAQQMSGQSDVGDQGELTAEQASLVDETDDSVWQEELLKALEGV